LICSGRILAERNWPLFYLTGATENRGELIRNFNPPMAPPSS